MIEFIFHQKENMENNMKKLASTLITGIICSLTSLPAVAKERGNDTTTYPIKNKNPFNLSSAWDLVDKTGNYYFFELKQNEDVEFIIIKGQKLDRKVTLKNLEVELPLFLRAEKDELIKKCPLLSSLILGADDEDDFMDDDEEEMDPEVLKLKDISSISKLSLNGIIWLNVQFTAPIITTHYMNQGNEVTVSYERAILFLGIVDNRAYAILGSAPVEDYSKYEELFLDVMNNLKVK